MLKITNMAMVRIVEIISNEFNVVEITADVDFGES